MKKSETHKNRQNCDRHVSLFLWTNSLLCTLPKGMFYHSGCGFAFRGFWIPYNRPPIQGSLLRRSSLSSYTRLYRLPMDKRRRHKNTSTFWKWQKLLRKGLMLIKKGSFLHARISNCRLGNLNGNLIRPLTSLTSYFTSLTSYLIQLRDGVDSDWHNLKTASFDDSKTLKGSIF